MSDDRGTANNNRRSEAEEQLLLKEWDFTRFFQGFNERLDKMKQEPSQETTETSKCINENHLSSSSTEKTLKRQDQLSSRRKYENHSQQQQHHQKQQQQLKAAHRRQESDSKLGNTSSAFARAFRRENSDFFPSARHSAYLQKSDSARSSIFSSGNRRGSEISVAGIVGKKGNVVSTGEPVLTDFSFGRDGLQRPRREKTESEIVFGSRHEARRFDFGRDKDDTTRRRSCRPSDAVSVSVDEAGTIKSTASTTASEYSPIVTQVSPPYQPCLCACLKNIYLLHYLYLYLRFLYHRVNFDTLILIKIQSPDKCLSINKS